MTTSARSIMLVGIRFRSTTPLAADGTKPVVVDQGQGAAVAEAAKVGRHRAGALEGRPRDLGLRRPEGRDLVDQVHHALRRANGQFLLAEHGGRRRGGEALAVDARGGDHHLLHRFRAGGGRRLRRRPRARTPRRIWPPNTEAKSSC